MKSGAYWFREETVELTWNPRSSLTLSPGAVPVHLCELPFSHLQNADYNTTSVCEGLTTVLSMTSAQQGARVP